MGADNSKFSSVRRKLEGLYDRYALNEVTIPLFADAQLFTVYSKTEPSSMLKLIDRTGKVLLVRPDATFHLLEEGSTNGFDRVSYFTEIVRFENQAHMQFPQSGVEIFNDPTPVCDSEIVKLAQESLFELGIKSFRTDIGHAGFINALLAEQKGLDDGQKQEMHKHVSNKNAIGLAEQMRKAGVSEHIVEAAIASCMLFGNYNDVIGRARDLCLNDEMVGALDSISQIYNLLEEQGAAGNVFLDLGFTNTLGYYSAMIFKIYIAGAKTEVISGGRYDDLASSISPVSSACGFGHHLGEAMSFYNADNDPPIKTVEIASPPTIAGQAAIVANALREKGFSVRLEGASGELSIKYGDENLESLDELKGRAGV
ncbi:MAG: ATP phosphoribosyltransferase regulatory subunit [Eubacteriaceae bacterium]|nr:ATP phosphoribosyltransferase regulatory subunit [Eubacteriaceae bacterium]